MPDLTMVNARRVGASISVLAALSTFSCASGIKFSPDSLNGQAWPSELSSRQYFKSAGVYYRNLAGLVGHVLTAKRERGDCPEVYSDGNLSLEQYLVSGIKLQPDTTAVERYSDKIDAKASVDASVLTFAGKLAQNQAAEVLVMDTTALIVPDEAIDIPRLYKLADQPLGKDDCERFFVRGAIVTTITYRTATEVEGNTTVSGTAFGASGKVYNASSKFSLDFRLGVTVLPVQRGMNVKAPSHPHRGASGQKPLEGIAVPDNGFPAY